VSSFGQVLGYFETLLDTKSIGSVLAHAVDQWAVRVEKKPAHPIIEDFPTQNRRLTRLFEVRHILCHETPRKAVYSPTELDEFLTESIAFAQAMEEVLTYEMFGNVPLTQAEMNISTGAELKKVEAQLDEVLLKIQELTKRFDATPLHPDHENGTWRNSLDDSQEKWLAYRNAQCEFDTYRYQTGTILPTLWAGEATRLTNIRIAELRSWLKRETES
jgi:uncharacterized protein YecT (DUF1311 family)